MVTEKLQNDELRGVCFSSYIMQVIRTRRKDETERGKQKCVEDFYGNICKMGLGRPKREWNNNT